MTTEQINETLKHGDKALTNQTSTADKRPLAWVAVIGVVAIVSAFVYLVWDNLNKGKRITQLETTVTNNAAEYQRNNDRIRLYYDQKNQNLMDENKKLWYKIGGMDDVKK